ncbi:hypothetical protein [Aminobacter carboxidus]|uniref:Uncharacterized protein n=1 Tax=Aminobacter carboxidus TaxID=376165 RepID=A0ABR9GWQ2_9HYPH|nr:hypothetical protein [Aminobacter carboxidus]MBE1208113.1 hypothetical protein [Aminobacter carboxidus]
MRSSLSITTPATSLALLTIEELRSAAGVTGAGQDTALTSLGLQVAASIMTECGIAIGSGGEPTLWQETLTETFRKVRCDELVLSRRHNIEIVSVTADAVLMDAAEYEADPESGVFTKLCGDLPVRWCATKVAVVYKAGFGEVPGDLKQAAMDFVRLAWLESKRDPALKSEVVDVPDVLKTEKTWWVGSVPGQSSEGAVPDVVSGQLARYRNIAIA